LSENRINVVIVGLGYVGLTLAAALARRNIRVYGIEKRQEIADLTNAGKPHFSEIGLDRVLKEVVDNGMLTSSTNADGVPPADFYIITVGTPLKSGSYQPRLDMIEEAAREVAEQMPDGACVILRSTVKIGTTRNVVRRVLESSGKSFHLAMCPERTLEGDALRELGMLPQIIGGLTDGAADRSASLFSRLTHTLVRVRDPETAEMIKLIDNTSRDVRFAFANEVARACDALGINAQDVIRYGKLGYPRTDVALPGLVGGPCLSKDAHILLASVINDGIDLEISRASRAVNERQPQETIEAVLNKLSEISDAPFTIAVAGLAFKGKPETDDLRGSMTLDVIKQILSTGACAELRVFDKVVSKEQVDSLPYDAVYYDDVYEACSHADLLIIANNHPMFADLDIGRIYQLMAPRGIVYDYWNMWGQQLPEILDGRYFTVGNLIGKFK
jgi:UDP-N-acetyl-D-mannosaminuronic acid dehydrogenase